MADFAVMQAVTIQQRLRALGVATAGEEEPGGFGSDSEFGSDASDADEDDTDAAALPLHQPILTCKRW